MLFKGNSSRLEFLIERIQAHKESPSPLLDEKCDSRSKEGASANGGFSWRTEEDSLTCQRGGGTPSSCTTSTSMSFASEPDVDIDASRLGIDANIVSGPYSCQFCNKSFPTLSYLKKHEQSHGDQMPYRCSWCARLFKHKRSRDRHVKLHTGDRRYRCTQCEAAFSRSDHLRIHMKTHDNQKPYHCTECSRGYNTAAALTSHMQSHKRPQSSNNQYTRITNDDPRSASWPSGGASSPIVSHSPFSNIPLSLMQKKKTFNYSPEPTSNDQSNAMFLKTSMTLACMYCTKDTFTSMEQLQLHIHATHESILNGKSPLSSPLDITDYITKKFEKTKNNSELKPVSGISNDLTTSNEESFTCTYCAMKFTKIISLCNHMTEVHRSDISRGSPILTCPLCGISCTSAASYADHYVLQHCDNPKLSINKNQRTDDIMSAITAATSCEEKQGEDSHHSPAATMEVNDCITEHTRTKNVENYSPSTLLCGQCGAAFENFESFRTHLATHLQANCQSKINGIHCPNCDLSFHTQDDMISHLTKHFLEQPMKQYSCDACDNFYHDAESLKKHLFASHAHHMYRCTLCHDTFDSSIAIQVHFTMKHIHECNVYHCRGCSLSSRGGEESRESTLEMSGNVFKNAVEMMKHVASVHVPKKVHANELSSPGNAVSTPAGVIDELLRCCFCGIYCTSDVDLQLHLTSHSTYLYRCPICREGYAVQFLLDKHIAHCHSVINNETIESRKSYNSLEQEEKIKSKRRRSPNINNNFNQLDGIKRPFHNTDIDCHRCEYCERTDFSSDAELRAHKKLAHKTPLSISKLSAKLLSHHICSYCGENLRSRLELEAHTRLHHAPNESGKRFKCNICDEVFNSSGTLAEHKLQKHCKIKLSNVCIVCRGELNNAVDFFHHVQKHSLETFDPQHQRGDGSTSHITAHCVVCRQTLINELECQLHAKYHLQNNIINNNNDKIQCCCICLRKFGDEINAINVLSKCFTSEQQLKVCKRCYVRHSQGLPILGALPNNFENNWSEIGINNKTESIHNITNVNINKITNVENNDCKVNLIKYEGYTDIRDGNCDTGGENCSLNFDNDPVNINASDVRPYCCKYCTLKFTIRTELEHHIAIHHDNNNIALASSSSTSSSALQFNIQQETLASRGQTREDNKTLDNIIVKEEIFVDPEVEQEEEEDDEDEDEEEDNENVREEY